MPIIGEIKEIGTLVVGKTSYAGVGYDILVHQNQRHRDALKIASGRMEGDEAALMEAQQAGTSTLQLERGGAVQIIIITKLHEGRGRAEVQISGRIPGFW